MDYDALMSAENQRAHIQNAFAAFANTKPDFITVEFTDDELIIVRADREWYMQIDSDDDGRYRFVLRDDAMAAPAIEYSFDYPSEVIVS